jgi:DNA-binding IclR family transcriptional regulator
MTTQSKARLGIQSVEVAGRILAALIKAGRPAALKDLARLAGMPPGKAHRYLVSLVRLQLVSQEAMSGNYGIGPMAITLGLTGLRGIEVARTALELMPALREEIDETVMLIIWGSHGPVVHAFEESSRPVFMNVRVGSTVPMLRTAAGKLFAAHLPAKQTRDLIEAERRAMTAAGTDTGRPRRFDIPNYIMNHTNRNAGAPAAAATQIGAASKKRHRGPVAARQPAGQGGSTPCRTAASSMSRR